MIDYREDNKWTVYVHTVPKEVTGKEHDMYYVGITSKTVNQRWSNGAGYKSNKHFWNAIQKHQWENITHGILASTLTKLEACEFEKSLIRELQSNNPIYGYNKTLGGEGTSYEHEDLSGKTFGHLYVNNLSKETGNKGERKWDCTCLLCGSNTTKYENAIKSGATASCGCYGQECYKTCSTVHGMSHQKIYQKCSDLKRKCDNPNCKSYKKYGQNGIGICLEWLNNFMEFYNWAIKNGYSDNKVLFLKEGYSEFSPTTCLWVSKADFEELSGNIKKRTKYITYNNKTHTIKEWAEIMGTTYTRLRDALRKKTFEEAFLFYTNKKEENICQKLLD